MVGWVPQPVDTWPVTVEALARLGDGWAKEHAAYDLRWNHNQMRMGGKKMNGAPWFASRWGWTRHHVRALMRDEGAWMDPRFARPVPVGCPSVSRVLDDTTVLAVTDCLPIACPLPANHHTRDSVTSKQENKEQEELLTAPDKGKPSTAPVKSEGPIPDKARDSWQSFRESCGYTRKSTLKAKTGDGLHIAAMVKDKDVGIDLLCEALQWLSESKDQEAAFYRGESQRTGGGTYKARNAKWIRGHFGDILNAMDLDKSGRGGAKNNGGQTATQGHAKPSEVWATAADRAQYRASEWPQYVPDAERVQYRRASSMVGGVSALGSAKDEWARKEVKLAFDRAFRSLL